MAVIYGSSPASRSFGGLDLEAYIAHRRDIRKELTAKRDEVYEIAAGIWAGHNRPGGHDITKGRGLLDTYIHLEGPVPHIVEYGRSGYVTKKAQRLGNRVIPAGTHIGAWAGTSVLRQTYRMA